MDIKDIAKSAKEASLELLGAPSELKNAALKNVKENIERHKNEIFAANKKDLQEAQTLVDKGEISQSTYARLKLDENKMRDMLKGIEDVISLDDPVNKVFWTKELDEGLILKKISCPIGVIGVIFEARPDVISQIASLAIKSGNAVILKGGRESNHTNAAIFSAINEALENTLNFPKNAVNLVFSRDDIKGLLELDEYVDLIIPRGSNKLVKYIQENTKIPVLGHASGICHIFVDESAKKDLAIKICVDAKVQYPSACNAVETILVHKNFPAIEELKKALCSAGVKIVENPADFSVEYGDKIVSLKIVENTEEAINHINKYGSGHTDSILSENKDSVDKFMNYVDSSGVYHNASTRFSDGFRYGFGAEVGISTNKTHARGPVGLDGLTIYKYKLFGSYQTVNPYAKGEKTFTHKFI